MEHSLLRKDHTQKFSVLREFAPERADEIPIRQGDELPGMGENEVDNS